MFAFLLQQSGIQKLLVKASPSMLEPLAATLLPALRCGRHSTTHLPLSSAMTVLARTTTVSNSTFPHDFFNPHPRHIKGKQRARPEDQEAAWMWMTIPNGTVQCHHVPPTRTSHSVFSFHRAPMFIHARS